MMSCGLNDIKKESIKLMPTQSTQTQLKPNRKFSLISP